MSNNHISTEAAGQPIPTAHLFVPSKEIPKLLRDFPTATAARYENYLVLWWKRREKYNTFVALCNYYYGDAIGDNDDAHILPLIAEEIDAARRRMMEDFATMEETLRSGAPEDEAGHLAGVGGTYVVAAPEEPVIEAEEAVIETEEAVVIEAEGAVVMEVEEADIPSVEN
ncbi:hypothetical protein B9Z19DRAFT_1062257 [Tuber borchii]|uniref:Uncharacterized protein n=1 Tax=Tuber borchii TaxID=42251 RepID=A0A2T7A2E2_TUBBO|nr:hypothetical protein B9Z19DRAFT_1062257 [Tuber borchii]